MPVETPQAVLDFWLGAEPSANAETLRERETLWFQKRFETDQAIAERFTDTLAALAAGLAWRWAEQGPQERLAAIVVLDQFSRNIFRDTPGAFAHDEMALALCKDGLLKDDDKGLAELQRQFFYLPLEHSESRVNQALSVEMFKTLAAEAGPGFREDMEDALDWANRHKDVIDRFGRFPHRNEILGRTSTPEELDFLSRPGSRF